jgi:hypothetical protein
MTIFYLKEEITNMKSIEYNKVEIRKEKESDKLVKARK